MKLRFVKAPRPAQKELTALTSAGVFKWLKVGDVKDVPDQAAHEIMAKWPGCLEVAGSEPVVDPKPDPEPKPEPVVEDKKSPAAENKAVTGKDYANKKAQEL